MLPARSHLSVPRTNFRPVLLSIAFLLVATFALSNPAHAQQSTEVFPLSQVQPGMQGYAYTIFAGDQIEKFDLEVIGVMPNFLGPSQSIILVQLKGPKVEHTGVVAGMSGSPVYIDGKLVGALSLKLGVFTKEPIAGVTPIADVMRPVISTSVPRKRRATKQLAAATFTIDSATTKFAAAVPCSAKFRAAKRNATAEFS